MNKYELKKLIDHLYWADNKVWNKVLSNNKASEDKYIRNTIFHLHMTQDAFAHLWQDREFNIPQNETYSEIKSIKKYADETHSKMKKYLDNLDELDLEKTIEIPWSKYFEKSSGKTAEKTSLMDSILQVIMHTTYHRGQVNKRLRELEIDPPLVDYISWLWMGKPANN